MLKVLQQSERVLFGDIGATNARFALLNDCSLGPVNNFEVVNYRTFADLIEEIVNDANNGHAVRLGRIVLAVAGPVNGGRINLTNTSWVIDARELRNNFDLQVTLVNDFEALAHSLPSLSPADITQIGRGAPDASSAMAVVGPGSGLGVACLVSNGLKQMVLASEGGHATFAGSCDREDRVLAYLRDKFGHASAERVLSGPGLENIYRAIAALDGSTEIAASAPQITIGALNGSCKRAGEALELFCAFLGSFAGNVALTFGARGGVYIGGGISPRILTFIARSRFRERFMSKGRFRKYLEQIPTYIITHPAATIAGLRAIWCRQHQTP